MVVAYVGGLASKAPFYARLRDAETGLYLNSSSQTYVELAAGTLGQFSFAPTQVAGADLWKVTIPAYASTTRDHVVELIRGTITSENASDPKHSERLQSKGVSQVLVDLDAVADDVTSIKATVETDIITVRVQYTRDEDRDEYSVVFLRNDELLASGISGTPTLTVKSLAGVTILTTALTLVSTGVYRHYEETDRVPVGDAADVFVDYTVDGDARTFPDTIGISEAV